MKLSLHRAVALCGTVAVVALLLAVLPSAAAASDKDCPEFSSQRAAQLYFLRHGGPRYDPDHLDGDDDGVACEDNSCPCYFRKHLPRRIAMGLAGERRLFGLP